MWRVGGKQSGTDISGCFCMEETNLWKKIKKKKQTKKLKKLKCRKTFHNQTVPKEAECVLFLTKKRRAFLSGVLIQLKINTGNEAASLSKRAASLPFSLYGVGRRQCWLCCQDAAQTLEFFFLDTTLAGLCIVPLSFLHQPVSAKDENYSWLDRNFGATAVIGWPAERAEMDRGGGKGAIVCLLYAAFC